MCEQALELTARERPDVVLMDLSKPGMGGAEATRRLLAAGIGARVVVLTSLSARERIRGRRASARCSSSWARGCRTS